MKIKVYTTNTCAYCAAVKKFLEKKGKSFEIVNLDEHPELQSEAQALSGALTVPITAMFDDQNYPVDVIIGWNPARLAAIA